MPKCRICKKEEAVYIWQPDLGSTIRESFYTPGYHQRGFMTIKVCTTCTDAIKAGKDVSFRYHCLDWWTQGNQLINMSMVVYH